MTSPKCVYFQNGRCVLGLYGGEPHAVNCNACIIQGNNNPEFAERLFASREKTHPPNARRISGCCDPPPPVTDF